MTTVPTNSPSPRRKADFVAILLLLPLCLPLGTLCHEVVGHGLTAVLCGGRVTEIQLLGFRIWPDFKRVGTDGYLGRTFWEDIPTERSRFLTRLAGLMSSWAVSVIAVTLLWVRRWGRVGRLVLTALGLWWIDLFTYTLPSWGLRRASSGEGRTVSRTKRPLRSGFPAHFFKSSSPCPA